MDPVSVTGAVGGALAAGGHVLSLLKGTAEHLRNLGKSEAVNDLIEVQLAMMDLLQRQQELIDENRGLRQQVLTLREIIERKSKLEYHFNTYWLRHGPDLLDGPYSPREWDTEQKLVRIRAQDRGQFPGGEKIRFYCTMHKESFAIPTEFLRKNNVAVETEVPR